MNPLNGPIIYDSLDKPNNDTRRQPVSVAVDYRPVIISVVTGLFTFFCVFTAVYFALTAKLKEVYGFERILVQLCIYAIIIAPIILGIVSACIGLYWMLNHAHRVKLVNTYQHQTTIDRLNDPAIIQQFMSILETRAEQSIYAGVSTLTQSNTARAIPDEGVITQSDVPEQTIPAPNKPILDHLLDQGVLGRSNNSLFIGFAAVEEV